MSDSDETLTRLMGVGINPDSVGDGAAGIPDLSGYEIDGILGEGGMGTVYVGRRVSLDRQVAIKIMRKGEAGLDTERLLREGKALARLSHAHIIGVHDFVIDAAGHSCLIMEYVSGGDLDHRLRQGALPFADAHRIFTQIVEAVGTAHVSGIIHRDLKPANILFTEQGSVKVGDFGLAGFQQNPDSLELTLSGTMMGTLDYMSPEQKTGMENVDARSDIYSLGILFYEMLSGRRPRGVFSALKNKKCDRLVRRCMRENPQDRYQSCEALLQDLAKIRPPIGRRKAGVIGGVLIALLGFSWVLFRPDPLPPAGGVVMETPSPLSVPPETVSELIETQSPVDLLKVAADNFEEVRSRGRWHFDEGVLVTERQAGISEAWISLLQEVPESYELRVEVERTEGTDSVPIFFTTGAGRATFEIDAWNQGLGGIQNVDGQDLRQNETRFSVSHAANGIDRILLRVRPEWVEVQVNDAAPRRLLLAGRQLSINSIWPVPDSMAVGVGVWQGRVRFHRIELQEIETGL